MGCWSATHASTKDDEVVLRNTDHLGQVIVDVLGIVYDVVLVGIEDMVIVLLVRVVRAILNLLID